MIIKDSSEELDGISLNKYQFDIYAKVGVLVKVFIKKKICIDLILLTKFNIRETFLF